VIDITSPQLILEPAELPDLAPMIHRQRLVIEGRVDHAITAEMVSTYLTELSDVLEMTTLLEPTTHRSDAYGWAGWIHWETSGAHFYAWEQPLRFFSVDIYTCKAFNALDALDFTADFFDTSACVAKAF
jgi:S-adenosylmethionine decarboxylase